MERRVKLDNKDLQAITDALDDKADVLSNKDFNTIATPPQKMVAKQEIEHVQGLAEKFRCMIELEDEEHDG